MSGLKLVLWLWGQQERQSWELPPPFLPEVVTRAPESQQTQAGTQSDIGVHCSSKNLGYPPNVAPGKRSLGGQEEGGPCLSLLACWPLSAARGSGDEALNSWGPQGKDPDSSPSQPAPPSSSLACPGAPLLLSCVAMGTTGGLSLPEHGSLLRWAVGQGMPRGASVWARSI